MEQGVDKEACVKFLASIKEETTHIEKYYVEGDASEEMMREFQVKELPFCVLMDDHGLISWSGHPDNRDLTLDLAELREGRHLIDIEDWLDDPEEPRLDPVEYPNNVRPSKKPKSLADTFFEQNEKF